MFFHRDNSSYNQASVLSDHEPHTSQRAQLYATFLPIKLAKQTRRQNGSGKLSRHQKQSPLVRLRHVVIKPNAEYVSQSMKTWIWEWEKNGYVNTRGCPVANQDLSREIHEDIGWLNDMGVHVDFWLVRKRQVAMTHCLADAA